MHIYTYTYDSKIVLFVTDLMVTRILRSCMYTYTYTYKSIYMYINTYACYSKIFSTHFDEHYWFSSSWSKCIYSYTYIHIVNIYSKYVCVCIYMNMLRIRFTYVHVYMHARIYTLYIYIANMHTNVLHKYIAKQSLVIHFWRSYFILELLMDIFSININTSQLIPREIRHKVVIGMEIGIRITSQMKKFEKTHTWQIIQTCANFPFPFSFFYSDLFGNGLYTCMLLERQTVFWTMNPILMSLLYSWAFDSSVHIHVNIYINIYVQTWSEKVSFLHLHSQAFYKHVCIHIYIRIHTYV